MANWLFILLQHQSSALDVQQKQLKKQNINQKSVKEEQVAGSGWPSLGQMTVDLSKLAFESLRNAVVPFIPSQFTSKQGLTPLKDTLKMPTDEVKVSPQLVQKQRAPAPLSESRQAYPPNTSEKYPEAKVSKTRSATMKDASLSSKHRSSKRQEYSEFYGSSEVPHHSGQTRSKAHKERKHRHRDKSGEVSLGAHSMEPKPSEFKPGNYGDPRFNPYNAGNRYMQQSADGPYRF